MLKEILYTGIGAATLLKERVEKEVEKLEERGKLGKADAKAFLDAIEERGKEEEEAFKTKLKDALKEVIDELGLATKADIQALNKENS
jgi:polyhydroxyalkanoate synthesis regulator phasin